MRVRITKHCDIGQGDTKRALFAGQEYDLPSEDAARLIEVDAAVSLEAAKPKSPPQDKAKAGPQGDK